MKIKTRIILTFSLTVGLVAVLAGSSISYNFYRELSRQSVQNLSTISELRSETVRAHLEEKKEFVLNLSASSVFRDLLKESTGSASYKIKLISSQERLERTLATYGSKDVNGIYLLDKNGFVLASTNQKQIGQSKRENAAFLMAQTSVFVGNPHLSNEINKIIYDASAIIRDDKTGELLGVIVSGFDLNHLSDILLNRNGLGQTGETFLVNRDQYFLTSSLFLGQESVLRQKAETINTAECFNPTEITKTIETEKNKHQGHAAVNFFSDYRGVAVVGTHAYLPETDWCMVTKIDRREFYSPIYRLILSFFSIAGCGLFLFLGVCFLVAKKITDPINELYQGAEIVKQGNLDYKVGTSVNDEVGQLSRSFDTMVDSIKKSRAEVDQRVAEQTKEITAKSQDMEEQRQAILNILDDVDEEKQRVTLEKDKIDAILHSIGDGVFVIDTEGKIVLVNDIAANFSGYTSEEMLGQPYTQVLNFIFEKDGQTNDLFVKKAISTGKIQEMSNHTILIRKDGSKIAVADSAAPLKDKVGKVIGCVVVFRDVTKEREVDRMKTEFISLASHQLRTPLSAMRWFCEMLLNGDAGKLTNEQVEYVDNISQSNQRMIALVNSLLNISRIESGRIIVDPLPTDLSSLINQVISELRVKIEEKKQNLVISVHSGLPKINLDPKLIGEVYKNLISNAIKYTPVNGEISIFVSRKGDQVISQITDNGLGIPEKEQRRVFEKFFRAENVVKLETEGTGLGLYLAKSIVDSSGGKIWFESREGKGTTFWFSLPLAGVMAKKGEVTINS